MAFYVQLRSTRSRHVVPSGGRGGQGDLTTALGQKQLCPAHLGRNSSSYERLALCTHRMRCFRVLSTEVLWLRLGV